VKLYIIGTYNDDNSSDVFELITARNSDEAWWKAQAYMGEMLGVECEWIMEVKSIESATVWANAKLEEKYQC